MEVFSSPNVLMCLVVFFSYIMKSCANSTLPQFTIPCNELTDDCVMSSFRTVLPQFVRGNQEFGLDVLDPFLVDHLDLTLPGNLKITFKKGFCKGFRKCAIESAKVRNNHIDVQIRCNLTIKGKYKSSGQLLMFPIDGDGDAMIKCRDLRINFYVQVGTKNEDATRYLDIKSYRTSHSYDGKVMYRFTNLFKGSPEMSKMVLDFMNSNWKLVADEFGKPIVDYGVNAILKNLVQLFTLVPYDQLFKVL